MTNTSTNNANLSADSVALDQWGLIHIQGLDASHFLQNQLTNSAEGLAAISLGQVAAGPQQVRLMGYCTPKGRLMASGWLVLQQTEEPSYFLFLSKDIAASFAKRLAMYVLRAKVQVRDVSNKWLIKGSWQRQSVGDLNSVSALAFPEQAMILSLPPSQIMVEDVSHSYARFLFAIPSSPYKPSSTEDVNNEAEMWNFLEVMSAIPRIVLATQDQFVPQMINFESVYGIDFKKGCYPGQEIVARSQYRGVIKRRLYLAYSDSKTLKESPTLFQPGVEIFHSNDPSQPAGMVVLSAPNPFNLGQFCFQIECKSELVNSTLVIPTENLHLGAANGPLLFLGEKLPYPLLEI